MEGCTDKKEISSPYCKLDIRTEYLAACSVSMNN